MTVDGAGGAIDEARPVGDILARLAVLSNMERVSVGAIRAAFGEASFLPALMIPALIVVSPLSAIFFLPTVMGLSVALVAAQMLSGRRALWLPRLVTRQSLPGDSLARALVWLERPGDWLDRQTRRRLGLLFVWPLRLVPVLGCLVSGLMMPFLELVPLSSSVLGLAITLFALGLLARDGVFVIIGLMLVGLASVIPLLIMQRFT
ncbi:MAG: exopolysaccharide biosynthesis protein [Rubellimicrobium sp.]|nr:exopolysaccharide biosynthesis protein [Rubellimicrobium sp.]